MCQSAKILLRNMETIWSRNFGLFWGKIWLRDVIWPAIKFLWTCGALMSYWLRSLVQGVRAAYLTNIWHTHDTLPSLDFSRSKKTSLFYGLKCFCAVFKTKQIKCSPFQKSTSSSYLAKWSIICYNSIWNQNKKLLFMIPKIRQLKRHQKWDCCNTMQAHISKPWQQSWYIGMGTVRI